MSLMSFTKREFEGEKNILFCGNIYWVDLCGMHVALWLVRVKNRFFLNRKVAGVAEF